MDRTLKGIAWIGNIYQKLEAACLEVDDIVNEEALRYVENQVQTVGSNVKQFCTEFVQDVLFSHENGAEEHLDMALMQKADISAYHDCLTGLHGDQTAKEVSLHSSGVVCSETCLDQSSDSEKCDNLEVGVAENPVDGQIQLVTECKSTIETMVDDGSSSCLISMGASDSLKLTQCHKSDILKCDSIPDPLESAEKSGNDDPELNTRTVAINQEALESPDMSENLVVGVTENPVGEGHVQQETESKSLMKMPEVDDSSYHLATSESCSSLDLAPCLKVEILDNDITPDSFYVKSPDKSENVDLAEINNRTHEINMESLEVLDLAKLEESCIMVDGSESHSLTNEGKGRRSYKKKLKEAFFSRRMLPRGGQELDDRTRGWHNQQKGNLSEPSILDGKSDSSNLECGDSDWELV